MITDPYIGYWPERHRLNIRRPHSIELGLFYSGEIPPRLEHIFLDADGGSVDFNLGDWEVEFTPTGPEGATFAGEAAFSDTQGQVTYTWAPEDFNVAGTYEAKFYVWDGSSNAMMSSLYQWRVV